MQERQKGKLETGVSEFTFPREKDKTWHRCGLDHSREQPAKEDLVGGGGGSILGQLDPEGEFLNPSG